MRTLSVRVFLAASVIAFAFGCAPQPTETIKLYEDSSRVTKVYKRLLVVNISSDQEMQELFENEIVAGLNRSKVESVASHHTLDASNGIPQDDINQLADELGTDGILITHIVSLETTMDREEGREEILSTCRGGSPVEYFLYDHKILAEPDSIKVAHTVAVITNLYDTVTRQRVWSIQSTCFDKASMAEVLLAETEAIVRQLRIDKLI